VEIQPDQCKGCRQCSQHSLPALDLNVSELCFICFTEQVFDVAAERVRNRFEQIKHSNIMSSCRRALAHNELGLTNASNAPLAHLHTSSMLLSVHCGKHASTSSDTLSDSSGPMLPGHLPQGITMRRRASPCTGLLFASASEKHVARRQTAPPVLSRHQPRTSAHRAMYTTTKQTWCAAHR